MKKILSVIIILSMLFSLFPFSQSHQTKVFAAGIVYKKISAGKDHTLALRSDGTVWAWGGNDYGKLGNGTTERGTIPAKINGLTDVVSVAAGSEHSLALERDGTVWAWGANGQGELGNGTKYDSHLPTKVENVAGIVAIAAGTQYSIAVKNDGTVWGWGYNSYGQLGDGTTEHRVLPVKISGISGVTSVSAGMTHTLAVKSDGTVWAWGENSRGKLGDGTTQQRLNPVQSSGLTGAVQVAAADLHSVAVKDDGTVWTWGYNREGQLGDGSNVDCLLPCKVNNLANITAAAAGYNYTVALKNDGTLWSWGNNERGQLGDGTGENRLLPVNVSAANSVIAISSGNYHNVALKSDGSVWVWGLNSFGLLGAGFTGEKSSPVQVANLTNISRIAAGVSLSAAIKADGTVWTWGRNNIGQLGDGTVVYKTAPVQINNVTNAVYIASADQYMGIVKSDGTLWGCGYNLNEQLLDGSQINRTVPVQANGVSSILDISTFGAIMVVKNNGSVWGWGNNYYGQIGDGTKINRNSPVNINGVSNITKVSTGDGHTLALKNDGTVWAWGNNSTGQLGDGTTTERLSPIQVPGFNNAKSLAVGSYHSIALKNDGTVWTWGGNRDGQLGNGSDNSKNVPTQVEGLAGVIAVSAGWDFSVVLKNDGTVWAWGRNTYGQLGDGTHLKRTRPVQVHGLNGIIAIASGYDHVLALKNDKTVVAWGDNSYGQLGNGASGGVSTPVQIPDFNLLPMPTGIEIFGAEKINIPENSDTTSLYTAIVKDQLGRAIEGQTVTWTVYDAAYHEVIAPAINSDGVLNISKEAIPGTYKVKATSNSNASLVKMMDIALVRPEQGGTGQIGPFIQVAAGDKHTLALMRDGTVWTSGRNSYGQLGDGTTDASLLPIRVKSLENIMAVSGGVNYSLALKNDGTVWSWGNFNSQLGNGMNIDGLVPKQISGLTCVVAVSAGHGHALALRQDGTVWAWGWNICGELGDGTNELQKVPVKVLNLSGVTAVAAGDAFSMALKNDGTVWAWGDNSSGQLGNGEFIHYNVPVQVSGLNGVVAIAAGAYHTMALKQDGSVWAWGNNDHGQLGNGTKEGSNLPVRVQGLNGVVSVAQNSCYHSLALKGDGTVWTWGCGEDGQLGNNSLEDGILPQKVEGIANVIKIASGFWHNVVLKSDGTVWAWGSSENGQLGNGLTWHSFPPVQFYTSVQRTLSGEIILPDTNAAPAGGISMRLCLYNYNSDTPIYYARSLTIPEGQNKVSYSIKVLPITGYFIEYDLDSCNEYVDRGQYSVSGTVPYGGSATPIDMTLGDQSGVNLNPIPFRTITGILSLPQGEVAPAGGICSTIRATSTSAHAWDTCSTNVTIPAGSNQASYSIEVKAVFDYRISYSIPLSDKYLSRAYFSTSGTVPNIGNADQAVDVSAGDRMGINLNILVARTISGKVFLPAGTVAPHGGVSIGVNATNYKYDGASTMVSINEGENFASYTIRDVFPDNGYRIQFIIQDLYGYVSNGYYATSGTVYNESGMTLIDTTNQNIDNVDLTLMEKRTVSGRISLPSGEIAPESGLVIDLYVEHGSYHLQAQVMIPAGSSYINYSIGAVRDEYGSMNRVFYSIAANDKYVSRGYYNASKTTADLSLAEYLDVSMSNASDINLVLISGRVISGTVSLPESAPSGGINLNIYADVSLSVRCAVSVIIPEGRNSVDYEICVPGEEFDKYYVLLYPLNSYNYFSGPGLYSVNGTVMNYSDASLVDVSNGNVTGINLRLIKAYSISGTFSLPNGELAPTGGYNVAIQANDGRIQYENSYTIPEGSNSIQYSIRVPQQKTKYAVNYFITSNSPYVSVGYYYSDRTSGYSPLVYSLDMNCDILDINLVAIKKGTYSLTFNRTALSLFVGEEALLQVSILAEEGVDKSVNWVSRNESIATVDQSGVIKGINPGIATIVATSVSNPLLVAACIVTVTSLPQQPNSPPSSQPSGGGGGGGGGGGSGYSPYPATSEAGRNAEGNKKRTDDLAKGDINISSVQELGDSVDKLLQKTAGDNKEAVEVVYNMAAVVGNLKSAIEKTTDPQLQQQLLGKVIDIIKALDANTKAATEQDKAKQISSYIAGLISDTAEIAKAMSAEENQIVLLQNMKLAMDSISQLMDGIKEPAYIRDVVTDLIDKTTEVPGTAKTDKAGNMEVQILKSLKSIIEKSISKMYGVSVNTSVTDGIAEATLYGTQASLANFNTQASVEETGRMESVMKNSLAGAKLEKSMDLIAVVKADANIKEMTFNLPFELMEKAKENGLDKVNIDTGIAVVSIPPAAVTGDTGSQLSLSVKKLDADKLTGPIREKVGDASVYDFEMVVSKGSEAENISTFKAPLDIKLPYELKPGDDPDQITVYYIDNGGNLVNVAGKYDPLSKSVWFTTNHFSQYVVKSNQVKFTDVENDHWGKKYIVAMAAKGVIAGMTENTFVPEGTITRAEFVTLIVRLMKIADDTAKAGFSDVSPEAWYYKYVASAVKAGIIKDSGEFRPDAPIRREDMAVMIASVLQEVYGEAIPVDSSKYIEKYTDKTDIMEEKREAVALSVRCGMMGGKSDTVIDPQGTAIRAEAATIMYRLFNY